MVKRRSRICIRGKSEKKNRIGSELINNRSCQANIDHRRKVNELKNIEIQEHMF